MHISDFRKFLRCPKMYQLSLKDNKRGFPFLNIDIDIDESIKNNFKIDNCYTGIANEDNEDSFKAMEQYQWLLKPRFSYRYLRVRVPLMHKNEDKWDLYFTTLSTCPQEDEAMNIRWTVDVLNKAKISIGRIYLVYLNKNYVREGELDDDQLWLVTDCFLNGNGHPSKDIIKYISNINIDIDITIDNMLHFDGDYYDITRSNRCTGRKKCQYYDLCFPDEKLMEDNSILHLTNSQYKYTMYQEGVKYLSQVDLEKLEGTAQQYAQVMADRQGGLFIDKLALKNWMNNNIHYPLSYIDFEWDLHAIPPYEKMSPMQVLCFEYSLDVVTQDGRITHHQYIGEGDCRKEFIEHMLRELPKEGTILAYNAKGAEVLRVRELMKAFPEYTEELEDVCRRFVDLSVPFLSGMVYDTRMRGLYSLKIIKGVINDKVSYHDLDVENGLDAVSVYRKLLKEKNLETKKQYYEDLYKYCGMDSYTMIEVISWLRSLIT